MKAIKIKLMMRGLIITALIINSVPLLATFSGGSGSVEDPWHVATASDFDNIRNYPDSAFVQVDDIDLGMFTPIEYFAGVYNGSYYTITANISTTGDAGLFTSSSGTLIRVRLENSSIHGQGFAGGIAAMNSGTILLSSVYGSDIHSSYYIGGIAGANDGVIKESYVSSSFISGYQMVGGITGDNHGAIEDSYTNPSTLVEGQSYIGGLVGENFSSIENCYSTAAVVGEDIEPPPTISSRVEARLNASVRTQVINPVGGLIGYCSGVVTAGYWDIETSGQLDSAGGEGRTTQEMTYPYDQYTYVDWDMVYIWYEDVYSDNDGYPMLLRNLCCEPQGLFAGGDGTEQNPYLIDTPAHLNNIRSRMGRWESLTDSYNFRLVSDIDLDVYPWNTGSGWLPIGWRKDEYRNQAFYGTIDFNNHTISNLYINRPDRESTGLFGYAVTQCIVPNFSNLNLENVYVSGNDYTGSLVGFLWGDPRYYLSGVDNCHIKGDDCHMNAYITGIGNVGGLVGLVISANVSGSSSESWVSGYSSGVGGLIGRATRTAVKNSYSNGLVIGTSGDVGGLIGVAFSHSDIWNCYSTSEVKQIGQETYHSYGGLIGVANIVNIESCYSTGSVDAQTTLTGGLIGDAIASTVLNSFWDMESSGQTESSGTDPQENYVGLTTVKMMQQASYPQGLDEWGFDEQNGVWAIDDWDDYQTQRASYPYLQWQQEAGEHNYPVNREIKEFDLDDNPYFWSSFPYLSRQRDEFDPHRQTAEEALVPLAGTAIDSLYHWYVRNYPNHAYSQEMKWNEQQNQWDPDEIDAFCSTKGYIVRLIDVPGIYELPTYGTRIPPDTQIPLYPYRENWIGYFIEDTQTIQEAFGDFMDDCLQIQAQNGGMYFDPNSGWLSYGDTYLEYGTMVKVNINPNAGIIDDFVWNIPRTQGRSSPERVSEVEKPAPEHFTISYGPDYESFFITDITDDQDVVEIGMFAGDECIGAVVFEDVYPVEIMTYANESHLNKPVRIVLYLEDDTYVDYGNALVRDRETGQYTAGSITLLDSKYTLIKIDRASGGRGELAVEEDEDCTMPQLALRQNYPNPFSLRSGVRGHSRTSISFAIPDNMPVELSIYNIRGQLVKSLISGEVNQGEHTVGWNGRDNNNNKVGSGIYFYRLETDKETITRKMLIVR